MTTKVSLWSLFAAFLKIGSTAFGGFMALISVVQNEVVERKKLLKPAEMLDGISLATILPGPVAVNVVAYVGYKLRGGTGALVSALGVILPAFLLILALSVAYFRWGQIPAVNAFFLGFIPAVAAIVLSAAWNMGRKSIKSWREGVLAGAAFVLLIGVGGFFITLATIVAAGLAGWFLFQTRNDLGVAADGAGKAQKRQKKRGTRLASVDPGAFTVAVITSAVAAPALKLLVTFAAMSLFLFGGGFVFIPLMQQIVVDANGWVTRQEFIDAIALGQVTPGPILISAAFIGYKVMGVMGAIIATASIFTPPTLVMIASTRFLSAINRSAHVQAAMRGIRAAVIGMIFAAAATIGRSAQMHWLSIVIFAGALIALQRFRVDVAWIIPIAGVAGLALY